MYPLGYFHQRLSVDGRQEAVYEHLDRAEAPIVEAHTPEGQQCLVAVPVGDRQIYVTVWHVKVGRSVLYLMDTDVEENAPWDQELSARLYGGDQETRILQEIVLGIGGIRVLRALGIAPTVWHLNEGHAAFVTIERLREFMANGNTFDEAVAEIRRTTVFTTHTPVPAGHDAFPFHLVEKYLSNYWGQIGLDRDRFLALGAHREPWGEVFHMTVLALGMAGKCNGVSKTHGEISRRMWQRLWPDTPVEQVPITAITNGVHTPTWSRPNSTVYMVSILVRTGSNTTILRPCGCECTKFLTKNCGGHGCVSNTNSCTSSANKLVNCGEKSIATLYRFWQAERYLIRRH